jgi:HTH-type transcriptional regulator / antitoxin HipB
MKLKKVMPEIERELKNPKFGRVYYEQLMRLEIARQLILTREKAGLTQTQIAKKMGVSPQLISRIEGGSLNLTLATLYKYARSLDSEFTVSIRPKKNKKAAA